MNTETSTETISIDALGAMAAMRPVRHVSQITVPVETQEDRNKAISAALASDVHYKFDSVTLPGVPYGEESPEFAEETQIIAISVIGNYRQLASFVQSFYA